MQVGQSATPSQIVCGKLCGRPRRNYSPLVVLAQKERSLESNWAWGLSLIVLTNAIHATGIATMAFVILRLYEQMEAQSSHYRLGHHFLFLITSISVISLLLAILHGTEAALWAMAYWWLGALESPSEAILYSVDSMSTRGASGLILQQHWHMMGALEAMDGMLLFGISAAFIFAVMVRNWQLMVPQVKYATNARI